MVLSSQTPRPMNRHRFMSSRRRSRRGPALFIGAAIAVSAVTVWAVYLRPTDPLEGPVPVVNDSLERTDDLGSPARSSREPATRHAGASSPGVTGAARDTAPSDPQPPTLIMGASNGGASTPGTGGGTGQSSEALPQAREAVDAVTNLTRSVTQRQESRAPVSDDKSLASSGSVTPGAPKEKSAGGRVPASEDLSRGLALVESEPVQARRILSDIVADRTRPQAERDSARRALSEINKVLIFSPKVVPGDRFAEVYMIQPGDSLVRIAQQQNLDADWRLLKRVNGITDERRIREGQRLKLIVGAFHAVVDKSDYRMDVYLGEGSDRVLVASFPVGLGEYDSTPLGLFKVRPKSKLINPQWTNPRTGERFAADDPKNPIGEYWIGLMGAEPSNKDIEGYGIHGTIDPASIGRQASMGCVRMHGADVELVYEMLTEPRSTVEIVP